MELFGSRSPKRDGPAFSQFIKAMATETYHRPTTVEGSTLQSNISTDYKFAKDKDAVVRSAYGTHAADLRDMMLESIGASVAFLVKAADSVPATNTLPTSPCVCDKGFARSGQDFAGNQQIARVKRPPIARARLPSSSATTRIGVACSQA